MRYVVLFVIAVLGGFAASVRYGLIEIPRQWNPWAPLVLADTPNLLTRWKLERLDADEDACQDALRQATMRYVQIPDDITGPGCGFNNAVRIQSTTAAVGEPFALSCRAAVSLAMWEQHVLQPVSAAEFGQPVKRLEHFGSYACRGLYGRKDGRRSQHATADALDVAGFVLADGHRIRVLKNWEAPAGDVAGDRDARFLRTVRDGACKFFDAVLSPDYNAAHRDHFHLDRGSFGVCR